MFNLDHHNMPDGYQCRWIKVVHLTLYEKLSNGKFTVQKTNRKFSKIALDQNHKQLNTVVGGAIALNKTMLPFKDDNWFINGPEVARLLEEFEIFHTVDEEGVVEYNDSSASVAKQFLNEVKIFLGAMDDLRNPFLDESFDLYSLDTKVVVEQNVTGGLMQVEHTGKKQLLKWVETRLHQTLVPITNTICKKNLKIFRTKNLAVH